MIDQAASPYSPPKANLEAGAASADGLTPATPGSRLAAHLLDSLAFMPSVIIAGVITALTMPAPGAQPGVGPTVTGALIIVCFVGTAIYQIVSLSTRGQTIGKRIMKIRIVRTDGLPPGFVLAVVLRVLVGEFLLWMIPLYGLVDCLFIFRPDRRCIHDLIAGTRVVMAGDAPAPIAVAAT